MGALIINIDDMLNMDDVPDGVVVCDKGGEIRAANASFLEMFGYRDDELIGQKIEILIPSRYSEHSKLREHYLDKPVKRPMGMVQQIFGVRKDGTEIPIDISLKPAASGDHVVCFARDISEHVALTDKIRKIAYFDPVTKALNRRAFNDDLKASTCEVDACSKGICVALFDVDHFKDVNDTLGHSVGDELLAAFCDRIREVMRDNMRLYRIGGDEFALIMPACPGRDKALAFVDTAIRHIRKPFTIRGYDISIGCSAGVVKAPGDGQSAEELISNADLALYKAKAERGRSAAFTQELRNSVEQRFSLATELRTALEEGQFRLHFQPKIDIRRGTVVGAEALLRWLHPKEGLLEPARFIDIVGESELASAIGQWVISEACSRATEWKAASGRSLSIAVNLFPRQTKTRSLHEDVERSLSQSGLDPRCLELELTENTIIGSSQEFVEILKAFRARGIEIALDDFGTGYASLNSLTKYPINTIKVDKSFVQGIGKGDGNRAVLKAVATLSRELGLRSVVEGVETADHALLVQHYGFDLGQGYFWGPPTSHSEFMDLIKQPSENEPGHDVRAHEPGSRAPFENIMRRESAKFA